MSKILDMLAGACCTGLAGLAGFSLYHTYQTEKQHTDEKEKNIQVLRGYPLSVKVHSAWNHLSTVIRNEEDKYILCTRNFRYTTFSASDLGALIESEINDGDNETIELRGWYRDDKNFEIRSVTAQGYTLGE